MYLDTEPFRTVSLESSHMNYHRSLSPPGPGLDCHKVSTWSQFLLHSSWNTQTSQSRNPRNHQLDLVGYNRLLGFPYYIFQNLFITSFLVANPVGKVSPFALFSTISWSRRVTAPDSVLGSSTTTRLGTLRPFLPGSPGTIHRTCFYCPLCIHKTWILTFIFYNINL